MKLTPIKANMTEIKVGNKFVLFSYRTPVAYVDYGHPGDEQGLQYYQTNKKWSKTTTRHINQWLNGNGAKFVDQEVLDTLLNEVK